MPLPKVAPVPFQAQLTPDELLELAGQMASLDAHPGWRVLRQILAVQRAHFQQIGFANAETMEQLAFYRGVEAGIALADSLPEEITVGAERIEAQDEAHGKVRRPYGLDDDGDPS